MTSALRVLFCGTDEFSIYSLRALNSLKLTAKSKISSIDVVCRTDKRVGRGLKRISQAPIKEVASDLKLAIHQLDSFQGWSPPRPVDLVVAVSFGLLVPGRILSSARYGGLNVHPSLLPALRGPAPIQHALLQGLSITGVTLQTMHPSRFDHGQAIDQRSFEVPANCHPQTLVEGLGQLGAQMLYSAVDNSSFVPPIREHQSEQTPSHAPKITPKDRQIDWKTWSSDEIVKRARIFGSLWDDTTLPSKRIIFEGPWKEAFEYDYVRKGSAGQLVALHEKWGEDGDFQVKKRPTEIGFITVDERVMVPSGVTIESGKRNMGKKGLLAALSQA
ncbi:Formyltransferase [Piedraia hortae CBS 480.64]|uniref:methionyl-tRNA formyltransferase n=1 Tax=Piedraia hortae CBS 480.64 TaxID=1314780 RepID=A0A6A7C9T6_9PEZI|nr:Formyltransferase [Piedraia hortae CBS 480.64]